MLRWNQVVRRVASIVLFAGLVVFVASCSRDSGERYTLVIPAGTYKSDANPLTALPHTETADAFVLEFTVGDTLEVVNQDVVLHAVGIATVRAGETLATTFNEPGEFTVACTLLGGQDITVRVLPAE